VGRGGRTVECAVRKRILGQVEVAEVGSGVIFGEQASEQCAGLIERDRGAVLQRIHRPEGKLGMILLRKEVIGVDGTSLLDERIGRL
jgi:hypothetical protein